MTRRPPRTNRTETLFPNTTLFRYSNRHSPDRTREGYRKTMTDQAPPPPPHDDEDAQEENEVLRAAREQRQQKEAADAAEAADQDAAKGNRGRKTAAAAGLGIGPAAGIAALLYVIRDRIKGRGSEKIGRANG